MPLPGYFPNVPDLPGVPQIPRNPQQVIAAVTQIASSAPSGQLWSPTPVQPVWGIYDQNGNQVIVPDSILEFGNRNEWNVASFPIQDGAFASYNKTIVPFENYVRLSKGGSVSDRQNFIDSIAAIAGDTNLYEIVTPEQQYENCNITRYEVTRRGVKGAYFLAEVDIFFVQVLQVTAQYSSTTISTAKAQDPAAQPATNQGSVTSNGVSVQLGQQALSAFNAAAGLAQ